MKWVVQSQERGGEGAHKKRETPKWNKISSKCPEKKGVERVKNFFRSAEINLDSQNSLGNPSSTEKSKLTHRNGG